MTKPGVSYASTDPKKVEEQLRGIYRKLNETETIIDMFSQMDRCGAATNDVRNFVVKQSKMKKTSSNYDLKLSKSVMRRKLNDAWAQASRLRKTKNELKSLLTQHFKYSSSKMRNLINRVNKQIIYHRAKHKLKALNKNKHCEKKSKMLAER